MAIALPIKTDQKLLGAGQLAQILPSLTAGTVVGILAVVYAISFAALIFSGDLSRFVVSGIGLTLFGVFGLGVVTTLLNSFSGLIPIPQDSPAALMGVVAIAIVSTMPATATPEEIFTTVVAAIILTSFLSGLFFFLLGWFKLGRLVRFMPYPVVGGFLAGTGWLIISGAISLITGLPLSLANLQALAQPDLLSKWLPALFFAGLLLAVLRRYNHFLLMPGLLLAAIGMFYGVLFLNNGSIEGARSQGWLFEPVAGGNLWQPGTIGAIFQTDWALLLGQAGAIGPILLVSVIGMLLNVSGIALAARREVNLDRELQVTGLANLAAAMGGSPVGYPALSLSMLGHRLGGNGRLTAVVSTALCGVTLLFGASLISLFPKLVLGGVLLFLGLSILLEWVYEAWFKLSKAEYGLVLLILVVITTLGFLTGVAVGLVVAVGLFVVNYSRVNVVKQVITGDHCRSNVMRPILHNQMLQHTGARLHILKLQGFIFFGTAQSLLDSIQQRLDQPDLPALRFVLLDFRLVTGLDSSGSLAFIKLKQLAQTHNLGLVFTNLADPIRRQLSKEVFTEKEKALWQVFPDLDHGLEWCETQLIQSAEIKVVPSELIPAQPIVELSRLLTTHNQALLAYGERLDVAEGQLLIQQGETPTGLFFIETGRVTVWLNGVDGDKLRLRTMTAGNIVGEVSWYMRQPASASVITDEPSTVYYLSSTNLKRMEQEAPELALNFHSFIACLLCERITNMNGAVQVLQ